MIAIATRLPLLVIITCSTLCVACTQNGFGKHADLLRSDGSTGRFVQAPTTDGVRITYFGTTSFLLQSRYGSVLVDPYLSRFGQIFLRTMGMPLKRYPARIADNLDALPANVDYIVATHGHFDHIFDIPEIAGRTGAKVLLSMTSFHQLAAAGLAEDRMTVLRPGETIGMGKLRITPYLSDHSPQFLGLH